MIGFVARRMLTHEMGRNALAVVGIFIALVMIFLQLGFYASVPTGAMQVYNHLAFDLMMTSSSYVAQPQAYDFPRRRLFQALSLPEVESAVPFYQGEVLWLNPEDRIRRDVFVMGFNPTDKTFTAPDIDGQLDVLRRSNTVLVDTLTLPMYGPQTQGRRIEIGERVFEIGGRYRLGTGFLGLGVVIASDLNFIRMFPHRSLAAVNIGLLKLKPGSDPTRVAAQLRQLLPSDTRIFTRAQLEVHEVKYWRTRTSTGIIFGFGAIISIIVGVVILYQTLATQVIRQLPQFATLKAIGYTDSYLRAIVLVLGTIMTSIAFVPAVSAAMLTYELVRIKTRLPVEMTAARVVAVLVMALMMSAASSLVAIRNVRRADPADLF